VSEDSGVRERILAVFSAKAKRLGIRSVVMGELASDLRMSASTLYKHFPSKDDLVSAMVDAWALELAAIDALDWQKVDSCASALDVLLSWADAWTTSLGQVPPSFFRDLRRDYPEQWERFNGLIEQRKQVAAEHLRPYLRDDVNPAAMLLMLDYMVMQAIEPRFVDRIGISRREAVRAALSVWSGGALLKRAKLRSAT
jgi:AcrR family transcriptional regulator